MRVVPYRFRFKGGGWVSLKAEGSWGSEGSSIQIQLQGQVRGVFGQIKSLSLNE